MTAPLRPRSYHALDSSRAVMHALFAELTPERIAASLEADPLEALGRELAAADPERLPELAVRKAARLLELAKRAVAQPAEPDRRAAKVGAEAARVERAIARRTEGDWAADMASEIKRLVDRHGGNEVPRG